MVLLVGRQVLIMVLIIAVGVITSKTKLISTQGARDLSGLLLYIVNPFLVFISFQQDYTSDLLNNFLLAFACSILVIGMSTAAAVILTRKKGKDWEVERFAYIFRNVGFFGIPVVSSIYGAEGVFYLSAFIAVFNIWCWSYGVTFMKGGQKRIQLKEMLSNMVNPTIIATGIGFVMFIFRLHLPSILTDSFTYIADMNTPLAMLITGVVLCESSLKEIIFDKRCYRMLIWTQIVFPFFEILVIRALPVNIMVRVVVSICAACPVAAAINMFALRFDKDEAYAAKINSVTTIMAAVTIPLMMLLY